MTEARTDKFWMARALELATSSKSRVQPNPMVGCVLVLNNELLSEGCHEYYGGPHAEVNAFKGLDNLSSEELNEVTAYITLEPCSHTGKTPPCADLLISKGIKKVITAMEDPNPLVSGSGHQKLKDSGIKVVIGVLEEEAREVNRVFLHLINSDLPYVCLKWAESSDGYIDPEMHASEGRGSVAVSSESSSALVQTLRSYHNAILVGRRTAVVDNPRLTSREEGGVNPIRIVIDPRLELDYSKMRMMEGEGRTIAICESGVSASIEGLEIVDGLELGLKSVLRNLRKEGVYSILVEGGAKTLEIFIKEEVWHEAYVISSSKEFEKGLLAPEINLEGANYSELGDDEVYHVIRC